MHLLFTRIFISEKRNSNEYSEPSQVFKIEHLAKRVKC